MPIMNIGELFCGAGGFGLGFLLANHPRVQYRPLFAIDNDETVLETYTTNAQWLWPHLGYLRPNDHALTLAANVENVNLTDVLIQVTTNRSATIAATAENTATAAAMAAAAEFNTPAAITAAAAENAIQEPQVGRLDLLIGGPPCQGYSTSNRGGANETRQVNNTLISTFLDKVAEIRPKMFLIENVQGVRWTSPTEAMLDEQVQQVQAERAFANVREFLCAKADALGYHVWSNILNSVDFGVPQKRHRFFLFGVDKALLPEVNNISLDEIISRQKVDKHVTVGEALADLPPLANGEVWNGAYTPVTPLTPYVTLLRDHIEGTDLFDHYATNHREYVIDRFRLIEPGENWEAIRDHMIDTYNPETIGNTHRNIYRRLREDVPAYTISHYRKSMIVHPSQDRGLSFREACRLQSFPDWFRFAGTRDQQQQHLANAVPPLMASRIAYAIAEFICQHNL